MKKVLILMALLVVVTSLTSCNMIRGAGQDVKNVGDAVRDATR
jgi:predicted small secreted protein